MTEVDFWSLLCRKKIDIEGWRWNRLRALQDADDTIEIQGGVCVEKFSRGPRKGRPNWARRDKAKDRTLYVRMDEFNAFLVEWERDTGKCHKCKGSTQEWVGWSKAEGDRMKPCTRCEATGKAPSQ